MTDPTDAQNAALIAGAGPGLLDHLVAAALRSRLLVAVLMVLVTLAGLRAVWDLPIDAVPDVTNVQVQVLTDAPGLGPEEVERFVTYAVEGAMSGIPAVEEVRSLSRFGLSAVTVVFEDGTDLYRARQLVAERLVQANAEIPAGFGVATLAPISSGLGEIFQFEVRGDALPEADRAMVLRDVLEAQIAPRLRAVPGVVEVNTFGGALRTYEVEVTPERLAGFHVSLATLFEALERNNTSVGGGYLVRGREQTLVRGVALYATLDDIAAVVVASTPEGTPIMVGMLGAVRFAPMIRQGAVTRDGRGEVVTGIGMMLMGANAQQVAMALREAVDELAPTLPDGVSVEVFYDRTGLVERTIQTVTHNLLEGGALVIAVLLLTLGDLRGGLIVAAAIPLSMLVAFIGMNLAAISGNLMSLGAIDFGLIVDGSVVMIEHMVRVIGDRRARGLPVDDAALLGAAREVAGPVAFSVGVIILVYLPLLGLTGVEGRMFAPMAATVVFALAGSLLCALVLMPALAATFLRDASAHETTLLRAAHAVYRPVLAFGMRRRAVVTGAAVAALGVAAALGAQLGAEFVPTLDEGAVAIQIVRPPSVSLEESVEQGGAVERSLWARLPSEIATVVTKTGHGEVATDPMGVDASDVLVMLTPPEGWAEVPDKDALLAAMEDGLRADVPGVSFAFSQPIELRTNELLEGVRSDVALILYGDELDVLRETGDALARVLARVDGAADVKVERVEGLPMLRVDVDRAAIARLGLNASDVMDAVEALGGRSVTQVVQGRQRFDVSVRFAASVREDEGRMRKILIGRPGGGAVPLEQVARVTVEEGPLQISHERGQRRLTIEANVRGRDVAGFVAEAQAAIRRADVVPAGYAIGWGGQFENLTAASGRLALLVPLVLVLIFVLLQANFRSLRTTALVYANVPLAVTGGIFALAARGLPFSISAAVGFIALSGVAVMNGVVLVSEIQALERAGADALTAAREGAALRLRPVLMTALVAGLGFVPMALGAGAGAEVQRPLATVVIGGLLTSTLLTLVVLPSLYAWAHAPRAA